MLHVREDFMSTSVMRAPVLQAGKKNGKSQGTAGFVERFFPNDTPHSE